MKKSNIGLYCVIGIDGITNNVDSMDTFRRAEKHRLRTPIC